MRATVRHVRLSAILLVLLFSAGCGIQVDPVPSQLSPTLPFGLQPTAVHIQQKGYVYDSNSGQMQTLPAVNVTRTDSARVTRLFADIRQLPTWTVPDPLSCSAAHYTSHTLITFLDGANVLMQVTVDIFGCEITHIVGYPSDIALFPDRAFGQEFDDLIANPT